MPVRICSWNCCLGISNKIEIVKLILRDSNIDILFVQEAEITPITPLTHLNIEGYVVELSPTYNQKKSRSICYIRNNLKYKRLTEQEDQKLELICLDLCGALICGYYRPFLLPNHDSPIDYVENSCEVLSNLNSNKMIIVGDFNIDYNKTTQQNFSLSNLYDRYEDIFIEKTLVQMIKTPTWQRQSKNILKESILDHVYCNNINLCENIINEKQVCSDHNLVGVDFKIENQTYINIPIKVIRDWSKYSKENLIQELSDIDFDVLDNSDLDYHVSQLNQILGTIYDKLIPELNIKSKEVPGFISVKHIKDKRKRKNLFKKFKKTGNKIYLDRSRTLEKNIQKNVRNLKRNKIRNKIKPGDSKSLWQAVGLSMNKTFNNLPETMHCGDREARTDEEKADMFCGFFNDKIVNIVKSNPPVPNVYNGNCRINNKSVVSFTLDDTIKILKSLPLKNSSGFDRVPLRFLNEGQALLAKTIHSLLIKIWTSEKIPYCWKITKTCPLLKKGNKCDVNNYRPISNLCSLAKVFEKIVLLKLEQVADNNNIDLTGTLQHGFKKLHSTNTAMLSIQNVISKALDKNNYAALISLDLSAAFDVVDHSLLLRRLQVMGLPTKIISLLQSWLLNRKMYVDVNGECSIFTDIIAGTLQGSCLGPILFALFLAPVYDLLSCFTYADDNYSIETGSDVNQTVGKVKFKVETLISWLAGSGMKVNTNKTEFCIFHRNDTAPVIVNLAGYNVTSKNTIKVLGVLFDSKLNWAAHIENTIQKCKKTLQAIRLISDYFNIDERLNIVTSLFYSKLYYGADVWLIPSLKSTLKKKLSTISTQALRIAANDYLRTFNCADLHVMFNRFTPSIWGHYCALLNLHRIINNHVPEEIWIELQTNSLPLTRANKTLFPPKNKLKVGINSILNRLSFVSTLITNDQLNFSSNAFKVLIKRILLNVP